MIERSQYLSFLAKSPQDKVGIHAALYQLYRGARRQFNLRRWEMQGDFYYGLPTSKYLRPLNGLPAR